MVDSPLTVGSAFAGIGGFDLAAERAGMHIAWQIEIERWATAVLTYHWPGVPRYRDIRCVDPADLAPVDVLVGGFPCQDLSVAGKRAGLSGERSRLFFEWVRLLDGLRPRWFVLENVPGLLSSHRGRDFLILLDTLGQRGYGVAWRILDAQYFGVPQRRRRVFVVGYLGDPAPACQVLFERQGGSGHSAPRGPTRATVVVLPTSGAGTSRPAEDLGIIVTQALTGTFANGGADDTKAQAGFLIPVGVPAVAYALRADPGGTGQAHNTTYVVVARTLEAHAPRYDSETETLIGHALRAGRTDASEDETEYGVLRIADTLTAQYGKHGGAQAGKDAGVRNVVVAATLRQRMRGATDEVMDNAVISYCGVRKLTPREFERLQGFPDDWTRWGADGRPISDSARYRLLGNAVAVPVVEWILRRLALVAAGRPASRTGSGSVREGG